MSGRRSGEPRAFLPTVIGRVVFVHTSDDQTYEGVLTEEHTDGLVLHVAKLHTSNADNPVPMAGQVFIPRANLRLLQLPD